jgi:DNA-binding XRE family transcriptional regulator
VHIDRYVISIYSSVNWYDSTEIGRSHHQPADKNWMNTFNLSIDDLQGHLGDQLRRLRLSRDLDQLTLADKAGVSEKALRNLEAGRGSSLSTLLQVLRALDRLDWLDTLAPVAAVSPMALLRQRPERRRVGRPRGPRRKAAATK